LSAAKGTRTALLYLGAGGWVNALDLRVVSWALIGRPALNPWNYTNHQERLLFGHETKPRPSDGFELGWRAAWFDTWVGIPLFAYIALI
jgi:hypothetical protein